jgi:FkbM family methyltransferase
MIKAARNAAASAMAWTLYHAPGLEGPYAHAAAAARRVPGLHTLFRETTDRLASRLVGGQRPYRRLRIGSVSPIFDVSNFTVKGHYFAHVPYEPETTAALLDLLEPGGTFFDIGANAGYFTVLAALRVGPKGRVYAFEPNPTVRQQLRRHVEINEIADRVTIGDVALADRDEDGVRFFVSCWPENDGISSLTPSPETVARGGLSADATIQVRVRTFDTWMVAEKIGRIDLMKIDVEGAELQTLKGMENTFSANRPTRIICETPLDSEAVGFLRAKGYTMSMLDEIRGGIPNVLFESAGRV